MVCPCHSQIGFAVHLTIDAEVLTRLSSGPPANTPGSTSQLPGRATITINRTENASDLNTVQVFENLSLKSRSPSARFSLQLDGTVTIRQYRLTDLYQRDLLANITAKWADGDQSRDYLLENVLITQPAFYGPTVQTYSGRIHDSEDGYVDITTPIRWYVSSDLETEIIAHGGKTTFSGSGADMTLLPHNDFMSPLLLTKTGIT